MEEDPYDWAYSPEDEDEGFPHIGLMAVVALFVCLATIGAGSILLFLLSLIGG